MLLCTIPWTTVCTSLLFTLLFIKSQYTVFLFCTSYCFLHILLLLFFLHILFAHPIVFCTSYCFFAHLIVLHFFYFIAHFTLISPFLTTCMPLCYVTLYNLYSYYFALSTERTWFDYISLLIIPCITIMWQIKKPWTLNLELSAFFFLRPRFPHCRTRRTLHVRFHVDVKSSFKARSQVVTTALQECEVFMKILCVGVVDGQRSIATSSCNYSSWSTFSTVMLIALISRFHYNIVVV